MELLQHLALGFTSALTLANVAWCLAGALLGTLIGVLPGVGPVAAIAMLLPAVHALDATSALILLAAVYYGAQYGGSTAASLATAVNGDAMPEAPAAPPSATAPANGNGNGSRNGNGNGNGNGNRNGNGNGAPPKDAGLSIFDDPMPVAAPEPAPAARSGSALVVAAIGSFVAGSAATLAIALVAAPLLEFAGALVPAEVFALMCFALIFSIVLAPGSLVKAGGMILLGLLLGQLDHDAAAGTVRLAFSLPQTSRGTVFIGLAMGIFVFGAILARLAAAPAAVPAGAAGSPTTALAPLRVSALKPTREELRRAWPPLLRGISLGTVLGVLPGRGPRLAAVLAQAVERLRARAAGAEEAAIAPEAAHHAGAQTSFVPLLMFGTPSNAVTAMMAGALALKGLAAGPQLAQAQPALLWGVIVSMWIGNALLLAVNLPLTGLWARLLAVPYRVLFPALIVVCCVGLYSLSGNPLDVYVGAFFGLVGYVLIRLGCEPAPLLLAFVLGPLMEERLRQTLAASHGDWSALFAHPLSAALLFASTIVLMLVWLPTLRKLRWATFRERG
jgi:TctA family transporter